MTDQNQTVCILSKISVATVRLWTTTKRGDMGSLVPGATYIYERNEGTVYAREIGAHPSTRKEIGHDYSTYEESRLIDSAVGGMKTRHSRMMEDKLWGEIRRAARTNPTLQDALDHAIMIYQLTKPNE